VYVNLKSAGTQPFRFKISSRPSAEPVLSRLLLGGLSGPIGFTVSPLPSIIIEACGPVHAGR
jgi:hypothetical protein